MTVVVVVIVTANCHALRIHAEELARANGIFLIQTLLMRFPLVRLLIIFCWRKCWLSPRPLRLMTWHWSSQGHMTVPPRFFYTLERLSWGGHHEVPPHKWHHTMLPLARAWMNEKRGTQARLCQLIASLEGTLAKRAKQNLCGGEASQMTREAKLFVICRNCLHDHRHFVYQTNVCATHIAENCMWVEPYVLETKHTPHISLLNLKAAFILKQAEQ